jgi:hypothetical protein
MQTRKDFLTERSMHALLGKNARDMQSARRTAIHRRRSRRVRDHARTVDAEEEDEGEEEAIILQSNA